MWPRILDAAGNAGILLMVRYVGSALVLFLPTFLIGGTLPVLVRGLTRNAAELGARCLNNGAAAASRAR